MTELAAGRGRRRARTPSGGSGRNLRPTMRATQSELHRWRVAARTATTAQTVVTSVICTISLLALWSLLYALVLSGVQAHRANTQLYADIRLALASGVAPYSGAITPGTPVAVIDAPVDGLRNLVIVEGTGARQLSVGAGHRRDTPMPGQPGFSVLYGRSVTFGAPFADIARLTTGTRFTVTTGQGVFHYRVDDVRRPGDPTPVPLAAGASRLVLQTSSGGLFANRQSLFVDATVVGRVAPAGLHASSASVAAGEQAMASGFGVTASLVLWIQAILIAVVAMIWARFRWGAVQAWTVGLPLLLAALWGTSHAVLLMIPNLI